VHISATAKPKLSRICGERGVFVTLEVEALLLEAADDLADLSKTGENRLGKHKLATGQASLRERRGGGAYEAPLDAVGLDHDEGLLRHCC
jgi:hypothetical protein